MKSEMVAALSLCLAGLPAWAEAGNEKKAATEGIRFLDESGAPKSASASTVGARAVSSNSQTVFGGFELSQTATVYILVRGNSMGTLGITSNYLDAPHVRIFNAANQDMVTQSGYAGFNDCDPTSSSDAAVYNYYSARGIAPSTRDTCLAGIFNAGAYTFSVTPSLLNVNNALRSSGTSGPSAGEILFEVKLGP